MDESFSRWLALREPVDAEARSSTLTRTINERLPLDRPLQIVDLGTGTGSNLRYLIERLPPRQDWLLVDSDANLLAEVPARMADWAATRRLQADKTGGGLLITGGALACRIETRQVDFGVLEPGLLAGRDLVAGSALLDLVSDRWLGDLAAACAASRAAVLFALTYDGTSQSVPEEPGDDRVRDLMNQHQRGDKGFGPAVGPEGAERAAHAFERAGYVVRRARSDWMITPERAELQSRLLDGWHQAATALAPDELPRIDDWRARRQAHVAAGRSQVIVGHEDLAAWPGDNDQHRAR
jgi:hypothetical protein